MQDPVGGTADIARICQRDGLSVLLDFEQGDAASEHMAGIDKPDLGPFVNPELPVVGNADKQFHAGDGIGMGIEWLNWRKSFPGSLFIEGPCIVFLDMPRICEHNGAQVARGTRADHRAPETELIDVRDQPGVIDMGMGEDDVVDRQGDRTPVCGSVSRSPGPFPGTCRNPAVFFCPGKW